MATGPVPTIFTLPPGFRPAQNTILLLNAPCVAEGEEAFCEVDEAGDLENYGRVLVAGSSTTLVAGTEHLSLDGQVLADAGSLISLDGITFRAEG